jgi:hypothetical protein
MFAISLYNMRMSLQEGNPTVSGNEQKHKGSLRRRAAVAAGAMLLATGAAWMANNVADTLCNPPEALAIGGHPQPAAFCDEYEGFKREVAERVESAIDALIPDFPIVRGPVFDPQAPPVG